MADKNKQETVIYPMHSKKERMSAIEGMEIYEIQEQCRKEVIKKRSMDKLEAESAMQAKASIALETGNPKDKIRIEPTYKIKLDNPQNDKLSENNINLKLKQVSGDELLSYKKLAEIFEVSISTAYQWGSQGKIKPVYEIGSPRFTLNNIKEQNKIYKEPIAEKSKINSNASQEEYHAIFKKHLEPFTNVLIEKLSEKGYLDEYNARLMKDRFSKERKLGNGLIIWNPDIGSLMTFVYLADRLELFDNSERNIKRVHNTSELEVKEKNEDKETEVQFESLLNKNFKRPKPKPWGPAAFDRTWVAINNVIFELRQKIAIKEGTIKEGGEIAAPRYYTREETIMYLFKHKNMNFKTGKVFDRKILEIFSDQWPSS